MFSLNTGVPAFQRSAFAVAVAAVLGAGQAAAQSAPADDQAVYLAPVVVTAGGYEQKLTEAPASVTVLEREDLQNKPYAGLADALRDIEGIDVGSALDKNGNISITMRGLPADYTLILIDGRRQSDIGNIGPNDFGNSQFMYIPPMEAIERIEVVRGPMSTLYGADAIGGVINIITRKHADKAYGSISQSLTLQESSQYGDDRRTDFAWGGPLIAKTLGMTVRASLFNREETSPGYAACLPLPAQDVDGNANAECFQDAGNFGDKKIVAAQNWNVGATLNYTPTKNHDIRFEYDIARQRYDNTEGQTGTLDSVASLWRQNSGALAGIVAPRVGYTPQQRVEREQFVLAHNGKWSFADSVSSLTVSRSANLGRSLPLTVAERAELQDIWDQAKIDQGVTGTRAPALTDAISRELEQRFLPRQLRALEIDNLIFDTKFTRAIGSHLLVIGGQYFRAEMEDGVFGMDGAAYRDGTVAKHEQTALFIEDGWGLTDALVLTLGARYDHHNIFDGQFSPRAYLNYQASEVWAFKGGVSTGYKTPKPEQLFAGVTGFGGQGVSPFVGSPHLQPETSVNYELAAYFDGGARFAGNATVFFNDFKDKIATSDAVPNCYDASGSKVLDDGCVDVGPGWAEIGYSTFSQNINVDKAETYGAELAGRVQLLPRVSLRANYTYTKSEQKSGLNAGRPLVNTPEHMVNATLNWNALEKLDLFLVAELRDERYRTTTVSAGPQAVSRDLYFNSYELFHAGARLQVNETLTVHGRINNLFDKDMAGRECTLNAQQNGFDCANEYAVTERARALWLSANYRF